MALFRQPYLRNTLCFMACTFTVATSYYGVSFLSPRFFQASGDKYSMVFVTVLSEVPAHRQCL